ncbi:MAG: metallophosphoesterase, partial [Chloroflexota bacterium]
EADILVLTGDLIHNYEPTEDYSLKMVLDVIALQEQYGEAIIYLCGNHEMPHIYGISLSKGHLTFTPDFEKALNESQRRTDVIDLFHTLPFYVRTKAGVTITHAGAAAFMSNATDLIKILNWDHQALLSIADTMMSDEDIADLREGYARQHQAPYDLLAHHLLGISGPDDPRYNDLLRGFLASSHPTFDSLLWPALFTRCEEEYGRADYDIFVDALLREFSKNFYQQQVLVAGHMGTWGGYQWVTKHHLRLSSARHARPRRNGRYLLFDAGQPLNKVKHLAKGLGRVF